MALEVEQAMLLHKFLSGRPELAGKPVAIMGQGEGGMTALYAGALDETLAGVASIDYFQQRENCWQEPVDQTINGQLNEFGDAEVAAMIAPRPLLLSESLGGTIPRASVMAEVARAQRFYKGLKADFRIMPLGPQDDALESIAARLANMPGATDTGRRPEIALQIPRSQVNKALNQQFESWFVYLQTLIAASANLVNLLDLRPGRALKAAMVGVGPLALRGHRSTGVAAAVAGVIAAAAAADLDERDMLGDGGANALGAAIGTAVVLDAPRVVRLAVLAGVLTLTAASEKVSFTRVIEQTPVLRRIDGWGRRRKPDDGSLASAAE